VRRASGIDVSLKAKEFATKIRFAMKALQTRVHGIKDEKNLRKTRFLPYIPPNG